jgi:hypothetical protein
MGSFGSVVASSTNQAEHNFNLYFATRAERVSQSNELALFGGQHDIRPSSVLDTYRRLSIKKISWLPLYITILGVP